MTVEPEKRICVLGGGGFLGSHLVHALLEDPAVRVQAIDTTFDKLEVSSERLETTSAAIGDPGVLESAVSSNEVIVSTTALCNPSLYNTRPVEVIEANFTDLVPLVRLCTDRNRRLVHFSTCEVYGAAGSSMNEDTTGLSLGPVAKERWTYACAKQLLERLIWAMGRHAGLEFTIVRPFNVIGPRMDYIPGVDGDGIPRVLACFMRALLFKEPLRLVDGGKNRRSFVYVDDFVEAVMQIVRRPDVSRGEIINIGNPENDVSIVDLAERLVAAYRHVVGTEHLFSYELVEGEAFYGPGYDDIEHRIPDIDKAVRLLDWKPSTTLDAMLPIIVKDYLDRYTARDVPTKLEA